MIYLFIIVCTIPKEVKIIKVQKKNPRTKVCNLLSFQEKKLVMKNAKKIEKHEHFYR